MTLSKEQKQNYRNREQACGCQGEGGWGKEGLEFGISRCKLLYIGRINKVLLYSTGNYSISYDKP